MRLSQELSLVESSCFWRGHVLLGNSQGIWTFSQFAYTFRSMDVGFDATKDALNVKKHGISLALAEDFDFLTAVYEVDDSQHYGETRWKALGWLDTQFCSLTFTHRGEMIRAISLRKATRRERRLYAEEC